MYNQHSACACNFVLGGRRIFKNTWCLSSCRTSSKSAATSFFWELLVVVVSIKEELSIGSTWTLLVTRLRLTPTVGRPNNREARMRSGRASILNLTETSSNYFPSQFCPAFDLCHPFTEVAIWRHILVIEVNFTFPNGSRQKYTSKTFPPKKAGMMRELGNPKLWWNVTESKRGDIQIKKQTGGTKYFHKSLIFVWQQRKSWHNIGQRYPAPCTLHLAHKYPWGGVQEKATS